MGAGQSNIQVNEFSDACQIAKAVKQVKGLASNSASPSDTWILTLRNNVYYYDKKIGKVFMKYFIDPYSFDTPKTENQRNILSTNFGLRYEIAVYKDIIKPLIDYRICPNFIRFISAGIGCKEDSLLLTLEKSGMTTKDATERLDRNIRYMANGAYGRPSINSSAIILPPREDGYGSTNKNWRYSILINEVLSPKTLSMYDYSSELRYNYRDESVPMLGRFFDSIFQILYACYCMNCSRVSHNDLHWKNIYIEKRSKPIPVSYTFGEKERKVTFLSSVKVIIYDFDRAYSEILGDNQLLDDYCNRYSTCNRIADNQDMWKTIISLYRILSKHGNDILSFMTKDVKKQQKLKEFFEDRQAFFFRYKNRALTKDIFDSFNTPEMILTSFLDYSEKTYYPKTDLTPVESYGCKPSLFDKYGKLKLNPETNLDKTCKDINELRTRCTTVGSLRKDAKKQNKPLQCPPDKVLNPATGRCVSRTGPTGKKILRQKAPSPKRPVIKPKIPKLIFSPGKTRVQNPETKRMVKVSGVTGQKILKKYK